MTRPSFWLWLCICLSSTPLLGRAEHWAGNRSVWHEQLLPTLLLSDALLLRAIELLAYSRAAPTTTPAKEARSHFLHLHGPATPPAAEHFSILDQLKLEILPAGVGDGEEAPAVNVRRPSRPRARQKKKKKKKRKKKPNKKKKPKKKKQKNKKKPGLVAQPAHLIFASATPKPHHAYGPPTIATTTRKPRPKATLAPLEKIKHLLRHKKVALKKKKSAYLQHVQHVLYPLVKFVAFFTVLNPFTLGVFLFALISPVVFGLLGFAALSMLVKPALHLLFDVKRRVGAIRRTKARQRQRHERLRQSRRPITIHKHYYQQQQPTRRPHRQYNPLLPAERTRVRHRAMPDLVLDTQKMIEQANDDC